MNSRRRSAIRWKGWFLAQPLLVLALGGPAAFPRKCAAEPQEILRPPLWLDADSNPVPKPNEREVSELYAIVNNSWFRGLDLTSKVVAALERGALNVNAWDEVPDSSWFTNRIGRHPMSFQDIVTGLEGEDPARGSWRIIRIRDEGYTPKIDIEDPSGRRYVLKFDLPEKQERNSGAERICTLIMHAAGYNVPHNNIVYFHPEDLALDETSYYRDALGNRRPMTPDDLQNLMHRIHAYPDGSYRGMASLMLPGETLGPFVYTGARKDDPNDIIPHELRRELRGMRVLASWINHADVKDVNAMDIYVKSGQTDGYVKHYLLDFGSTIGSGDFIHGPYRVGHEYIYDGAAMGRSLITLGLWQRPWEAQGTIVYPEVGYFQADLFDPERWKPNYPNLAFMRMDDSDAYWGAKLVTAFTDETVDRLVETGRYTRPEVTAYLQTVLKKRRDAIGRCWFDRITPLEEPALDPGGSQLRFRDLAVERGYVMEADRSYYVRILDMKGKEKSRSSGIKASGFLISIPPLAEIPVEPAAADRYGRRPALKLVIQSNRREGGWAREIEIILGYQGESASLQVLGWTHAPK